MFYCLIIFYFLTIFKIFSEGCCSEWSAWTMTTECPDYCGGCASATFSRTCLTLSTCPCPGNATKMEPCHRDPCGYPRTACCGDQKAVMSGHNILCLATNETIPQPPQTCGCCPPNGIWSTWQDVNCSSNCGGFGTGLRSRKCLSEEIGCPCIGETTKTDRCKLVPCSDGKSACAPGLSAVAANHEIHCVDKNAAPEAVAQTTCCPKNGIWESWSSWSNCSTNCGGCSKSIRTRSCASAKHGCPCDVATEVETLPCNTEMCTTGTPCCTGSLKLMSNGDLVCVNGTSEGIWTEWVVFGCSDTCGLCGKVQRTRICRTGVCSGDKIQNTTESCGNSLCGIGRPSCCAPAVRSLVGTAFVCKIP
uniref:Uncharacterized protein n=1 Tax=Panagrolaimus sp. JU765 TaxID=591449 RepID=A0AC34QNR7_9BILA